VFNDGGDPNLVNAGPGKVHDSPLFLVIESPAQHKKEKIRLLLKKGAKINFENGAGVTPVMDAVSWGGQYDLAVFLLEAGADPDIYRTNTNSKLIHEVMAEERRSRIWTPQQKMDYERLIKWLVDHGESIDQAKADRERWKSWSQTTGEYDRKMNAEVAARKAKEAREKAAVQKPANDGK
jgi:hypothetical protein